MQSPAIAVFAASDVRRRYYSDIAQIAGFGLAAEGVGAPFYIADEGAYMAAENEHGLLIPAATPQKAAVLIDRLLRLKARSMTGPEIISMGAYVLDVPRALWAHAPTNIEIRLTEKEVDVLLYLRAHPEGVSRAALLENIWGYADGVETHTIETHIYRLRQKIEPDPANPSILVTNENGYALGL